MPRMPIQIIVIPYRMNCKGEYEFALFHRSNGSMWQFISGGGEDSESVLEAARREAFEEAGIGSKYELVQLDSIASIPRSVFTGTSHWPDDLFVVPEQSFAVEVGDFEIQLSHEHDKFKWLCYNEAHELLTWETNRTALWELNERLKKDLRGY